MTVYVWLKLIKIMISWDSMEEYHESSAYQFEIKGSTSQDIIVEKNTPLWRK